MLWELQCDSEANKTCWQYDNQQLAYTMLGMAASLRFLSICFYTSALCSYKPAENELEKDETKTLLKKDTDDNENGSHPIMSSYKALLQSE